MDIQFDAAAVKKTENKGKNEVVVTIDDAKLLDFLNALMDDKLVAAFFANNRTKAWLADQIGVSGLLESYSKQEVLEKVGWDYVKEFFQDHINAADILNYLGWEVVKEHFADKIAATTSQNDINNAGGRSILEALDASEGENK